MPTIILFLVLSVLSLGSCVVGAVALTFAIRAYIKVEAMEKSTHSIQYVPAPTPEEIDQSVREFKASDKALAESYADLEYEQPEDEVH